MPRIAVAGTNEVFACAADDTILRAALRSGLGIAYSCNSGCCGNCRFELEDGAANMSAPIRRHRRSGPQRNRWLHASRPRRCRIRCIDQLYVPPSGSPAGRLAVIPYPRQQSPSSFPLAGRFEAANARW
jgi:ferredoxin